jgi:hypothetical protein
MSETESALKVPLPVQMPGRAMPAEVSDERAYFAEISKETPRDTKAEEAFIASKSYLMMRHPTLDLAERELALTEFTERLGRTPLDVLAKEETPPVPGGVGYGFFYNSTFKMAFATGTSLYFEIVCPTRPGGNVDDYFYLTAMNRSGRGIEAFVSYFKQTDFHFKVFDWARTDHWQIDIPFGNLSSYLGTLSAHGATYQTLGMQNITLQISADQWRNEAWLWNRALARWDLIYRFDYAGTHAEQVGGFTGSWGPIVETFQPLYMNTNRFGFLNTQLTSRDTGGAWGSWKLLSAADSYVRTDNVGFHPLFIDPNYAFVVYSTP